MSYQTSPELVLVSPDLAVRNQGEQSGGPLGGIPDQISPELVLVCPELGDFARRLLGEPGEVYCGTFDGRSARAAPASAAGPRATPTRAPQLLASRREWSGLRTIVTVGAIVGVLVAFPVLNGTGLSTRPGLASPSVGASAQALPAAIATPRQAAGAVSRHLRWQRAARSSYYDLQVFRNGKKVFEAWPPAHLMTLPASWTQGGRSYRLTSGRYEWYVWPGLGSRVAARYGPILRHGSFIVRG